MADTVVTNVQEKDDKAPELRVFISSTFRDMQGEREYLLKQVFPELRQICRDRNGETTASRRSSFLFVRPGQSLAALQPAVGGKEVVPHAHDCIGRFFKIDVFGGRCVRNNTSSCLKCIALKGAGLENRH